MKPRRAWAGGHATSIQDFRPPTGPCWPRSGTLAPRQEAASVRKELMALEPQILGQHGSRAVAAVLRRRIGLGYAEGLRLAGIPERSRP